jgi:hypothetical protein
MTYTELVQFVANICENTFPTDDMNMFIRQAEQKIYNSVQIANLRKNVTGNILANNKYLSAPEDFLSVYSIAVYPLSGANANVYTYLLNKDVNFIREAYPKSTDTGQPVHYAIFGPNSMTATELSFIMGPTPDVAYGAELHYYYYPESIVTASTTWLGDNFDSALLNGTLIEAIRYLKGEADMIKMYNDMYLQSIALLKNLGDGKQRMDAYRSGQVRIAVN